MTSLLSSSFAAYGGTPVTIVMAENLAPAKLAALVEAAEPFVGRRAYDLASNVVTACCDGEESILDAVCAAVAHRRSTERVGGASWADVTEETAAELVRALVVAWERAS